MRNVKDYLTLLCVAVKFLTIAYLLLKGIFNDSLKIYRRSFSIEKIRLSDCFGTLSPYSKMYSFLPAVTTHFTKRTCK